MTKIDILDAYANQTQHDLFRDAVKKNLVTDYQGALLERFTGVRKSFDDMVDYLYSVYENRAEEALESVPDDVIFYVKVDLSQWLEDDILNGDFDIIELNEHAYAIKHYEH